MTDQMKTKPVTRQPRRMARPPEPEHAERARATNNVAIPISIPTKQQTKAAMVENLLASDDGVTLDAICGATGWLPHTSRAFLTGLRKKGKVIDRTKRENGTSVYRLGEPVSCPHADHDPHRRNRWLPDVPQELYKSLAADGAVAGRTQDGVGAPLWRANSQPVTRPAATGDRLPAPGTAAGRDQSPDPERAAAGRKACSRRRQKSPPAAQADSWHQTGS